MALLLQMMKFSIWAPQLRAVQAVVCRLSQTQTNPTSQDDIGPLPPSAGDRGLHPPPTATDARSPRDLTHYAPPPKQVWLKSLETGEKLGILELHNFVFGARPRIDILHRVVVWQRAKRRAGTAKVKDRGEVRGGGRKPRRQKGTGTSRQGSIRAPHWRGGGVVHGPRGPVSYEYTLPKKVRRLGLRTALSVKFSQGDLHVVDSLQLKSHKTKDFVSVLDKHGWKSVLFVDGGEVDTTMCRASANVQKVDVLPSRGLDVYSILLRDTLVLTLGAVRMLEARLLQDCSD